MYFPLVGEYLYQTNIWEEQQFFGLPSLMKNVLDPLLLIMERMMETQEPLLIAELIM